MSALNRTGAHAALFSGTTLDRLEFEQLAHDLVDDLCNVTDAVAAQAAAQTKNYLFPARSSTTTTNETETLQARRVKALEAIALALTTIAKKDTP